MKEVAKQAVKQALKKKIMAIAASVILPALPYVLGIIAVVVVIITPVYYAREIKEGASNFWERFTNFITFNGYSTDEEVFYRKLDDTTLTCENAKLVTSTIMYYYQFFSEQNLNYGEDEETIENTEVEDIPYGELIPDLKKLIKKIKQGDDVYQTYVKGTFLESDPYNKLLKGYEDKDKRKDEIYEEMKILASSFPCTQKNIYGNNGVCQYTINGQTYSDLKVQLLKCGHFSPHDRSPVDTELIDLEKYVLGVVYQEVGDTVSDEAIKAQAVAARSFLLTRAKAMPNSYGIGEIQQINGQSVISIRACTDDQAYCDPDRGCWSDCKGGESAFCSSGQEATMIPGFLEGKNWSKQPLPSDSKIRTLVESTAGEVALDASGDIAYLDFYDTDQKQWNALANQGKNYQEILLEHYGDAISTFSSNCTQGMSGSVRLPLDDYRVTSDYGRRTHPISGASNSYHSGIDMAAPQGSPVYAIAPGKVVTSQFNNSYGFYIVIAHDIDYDGNDDYFSLYAHNSELLVAVGDQVSGGQQIAKVGSTGNSTGPHLHFEIREGTNSRNNAVDPNPFIEAIKSGTSVFNQMIVSENNNKVYYYQLDYSNVAYCPNSSDGGKVSNYGCLPTSYAMVVASLRDPNVTPATIANLICSDYRNYKVDGAGSNSEIFSNSSFLSRYNLSSQKISGKTPDEYATIITEALRNNKMVVVNVRNGIYNPSGHGHYLVLASITNDGKILVHDPGSKNLTKETDLNDIKTNMLGNVRHGIWIFS